MTRNTLGRSCLLEANLILVAGVTNTYRLRWLRRVTDRQPAPPARPETCTSNPTVTSTSSNKGRL